MHSGSQALSVAHTLHLDSTSFSVEGNYQSDPSEAVEAVKITHGYSKDHRQDLKQFLMDIICSGDGDVPLFVRIADGNEADRAVFAQLMSEFKQQWHLDSIYVADSALYSAQNLQQLRKLRWITRVPHSLKAAQFLADSLSEEVFSDSEIPGYRLAACCSDYAGIRQRWLVIESEKRRESDLKQLKKRLNQQQRQAERELKQLMKQDFACAADAFQAAHQLAQNWKEHTLEAVEVETHCYYRQAGRPGKNQVPQARIYRVKAQVVRVEEPVQLAQKRAGRLILATNVLEEEILSDDDVLREYKGQQSSERGFGFLKDPLFFTSSVFLKTPRRVAALAMVMGLSLLVYTLGQRQLRQALAEEGATVPNQLKQPTATPTLRWIFQCFQSVHLIQFQSQFSISNLSEPRLWILRFFGSDCQKYYFLC